MFFIFHTVLLIISLIFIPGCIQKKIPKNKEEIGHFDQLPLFDIELSKELGIHYFPHALNITCLGTESFIVVDYEISSLCDEISPLLYNIYQSQGWTMSEIIKTNKYKTFSGSKPYQSLTVLVVKKNQKNSYIHTSIISEKQEE
jgi:hypothetical protein